MTRATFNLSQRMLEIDIQDEANYYHHAQCDKQCDADVHAECHRKDEEQPRPAIHRDKSYHSYYALELHYVAVRPILFFALHTAMTK